MLKNISLRKGPQASSDCQSGSCHREVKNLCFRANVTCGHLGLGLGKRKLSVSSLPNLVVWEYPWVYWITAAGVGKLTFYFLLFVQRNPYFAYFGNCTTNPLFPFLPCSPLESELWVEAPSPTQPVWVQTDTSEILSTAALEGVTWLVIQGKNNLGQMRFSAAGALHSSIKMSPKRMG